MSAGMTFNPVSFDQFTLTCNSTGGPATTVTWTRNSITIIKGKFVTVVTDTETATSVHSLTVTGRLEGLYTCSVSNPVSNISSTELQVTGKTKFTKIINHIFTPLAPSAPSDVRVTQNGLNSVLVSWTAGDMSVTGYFISYSSEEGGETNLSSEESDTNITISGLIVGANYTVNISAKSSMLPSPVVTRHITLGMTKIGMLCSSSIILHRTSQYFNIFISTISCCGWKQT